MGIVLKKFVMPVILVGLLISKIVAQSRFLKTIPGFNGSNSVTIWNNENIGEKTIAKAGTYEIRGICKGLIHIKSGISGTVLIKGPGVLEDIDRVWDKPQVIKGFGNTKVIIDGLTLKYSKAGHKAIDLNGPGSIIRNCKIISGSNRRECAGHIEVGPDGLMENDFANIIDDTYKVKRIGAMVKNSTADMKGNGSAVTLDYNGATGTGHYADSCIVEGYTNNNINQGDTSTSGNYCALCAVTEKNCSKIYFTHITIKDGKHFSHIIKIVEKGKGKISNVRMTGTLPDGASRKIKEGVIFSPVIINAGSGTIRNVSINFGGKLRNPAWHFLNGHLVNVNIDGIVYNGTYHNSYGNLVKQER